MTHPDTILTPSPTALSTVADRGREAIGVRIPEICPITELARDARRLIQRARCRQEPIVITQRGQDAAVLVPIELYRKLESGLSHRIVSPRLAHPEGAERFKMAMSVVESPGKQSDADV
jgi:prevent-host-death family protein